MKPETAAKLLVAYSGIAWGLFWLPLHQLEHAGMSALWAVIVFNTLPSLLVLPVAILRWRQMKSGGALVILAGLAMGTTQVFYALSLLNTDVVRAITLFYLNPVWTALAARLLLGEKLGPVGLFAMLLAFAGMAMVLHTDVGFPLPHNAGDWFAVLAGLAWAASVILLRLQPHGNAIDLTVHALLWTALILVPVAMLAVNQSMPPFSMVTSQLWWLLPFVVLVLMTGVYASMWAVPKLSPNTVSLLYMTEISTAAISAALLSDQEFSWLDGAGVVLIGLAGAFGSVLQLARRLSGPARESVTRRNG